LNDSRCGADGSSAGAERGTCRERLGSASETLDKYPHHHTMLAFRSRNGGGELHENYADLVLDSGGQATVLTGGEIADRRRPAREVRGSGVNGVSRQDVKAGDFVHIRQVCLTRCWCRKEAQLLICGEGAGEGMTARGPRNRNTSPQVPAQENCGR